MDMTKQVQQAVAAADVLISNAMALVKVITLLAIPVALAVVAIMAHGGDA